MPVVVSCRINEFKQGTYDESDQTYCLDILSAEVRVLIDWYNIKLYVNIVPFQVMTKWDHMNINIYFCNNIILLKFT